MNSISLRRPIGIAALLAAVGALLLALLIPAQSAQAYPTDGTQLLTTTHPNLTSPTSLRIWGTTYHPTSCTPDGMCSQSSQAFWEIQGNGAIPYGRGRVWVGLIRISNNTTVWAKLTSVSSTGNYDVRTTKAYCWSSSRPYDYYFRAYDYSSGQWSGRLYVQSCSGLL